MVKKQRLNFGVQAGVGAVQPFAEPSVEVGLHGPWHSGTSTVGFSGSGRALAPMIGVPSEMVGAHLSKGLSMNSPKFE